MTGQSWNFYFYQVNLDVLTLTYLLYLYRYRVIQYLIGKLLGMVKMSQEGQVVTALSTSIRTS